MSLKSKSFRVYGYTLIELAIVLLAVGLMLSIGTGIYNVYLKQKAVKDTQLNIRVVANAIADFKGKNGRYPCPAPLNATRANPDYGREQCDPVTTGVLNAKGIFGQNRQLPAGTLTPGVMVGAVPFRHLNLREDDAVDGYEGRLLYAVTASQAIQGEYTLNGGAIEVKDGSGKSALNPVKSADLVIVSMGPDNAGAVMKNGSNSTTPCTGATVLQSKNCALGNQAIYQSGPISTSGLTTNTHMDDTMTFFARGEQEPWDAGANTEIYNKNEDVGKVGIMTEDPGVLYASMTTLKADVVGNVRVRNSLYAEKLADTVNDTVFTEAQVIGGDLSAATGGLKCDNPEEYLYAITENKAQCAYAAVTCPNKTPVIGITASGDLICQNDSCVIQPVDLCGSTQNLPKAKNGIKVTLSAGDSLKTTFQCKKGEWVSVKTTGVCVCKPITKTETVPCGPGYSGKRKIQHTRTCPSGNWASEVELSNSCKCTGGNQTRTVDCPAGQTGEITQKRTLTCTGASSGNWSSWVNTGNTCKACAAETKQQTLDCPDGSNGKIVEKAVKDCVTNKYGPWTQVSNTCNCVPGRKQTRTVACSAGKAGEIVQERTLSCPGGWSAWTESSNTCVPTTQKCRWRPNGGAQRLTFRTSNVIGSACSCGATGSCHVPLGGGYYAVYDGCGCE
jgi:type II secretory pathway pseudopilin PulG